MSNTTISSRAKVKELTTPQLLKGGLLLTWGASLLLLFSAIGAVQNQRQAIKSIGIDGAPSVLNAQRIQDSLADMDANVANELLAKPGQNPEAVDSYNNRREKLSKLLVAVAENITYDDQERIPIQTIQAKVGDYIQQIQQARDFHARGDEAAMLRVYRSAAEVMDTQLLPAAEKLSEVNNQELTKTYQNQKASAAWLVLTVSGLLLLGILVQLQLFLSRRTRRRLNLGLLAATAIAVIFLGNTYRILLASSIELRIAKEDAFDSLYALRKARSLAYGANGDESRYLLDAQFAQKHEQAFFQKANQILSFPNGKTSGGQGYLATAANNITFGQPEKAALDETIRAFQVYLGIDRQIRDLQIGGKRQAAIALCVGNNPGQSNWAFDQYRAAHQQVLNVNMAEFQKSIQRGLRQVGTDTEFRVKVNPNAQTEAEKAANEDIHTLDTINKVEIRAVTRAEGLAVGAVSAIALFTLLGLLPCLKEYSR